MTTAEIIQRAIIISIEGYHMCPNSYFFCVLVIWDVLCQHYEFRLKKFFSIRQLSVYLYNVGANTKQLSDYETERSKRPIVHNSETYCFFQTVPVYFLM